MSRATNLAGFVSAIYPSDNLSVGVLTARYLDVTGIATFASIDVQGLEYAKVAGIATFAETAGIATYAETAGIATNATYATTAGIATNATYATTAGIATNATYATTAGIATVAEGLTGSPDIIVGNITSSGDVSIAGTITYEDVASVDSVGVITAREGIRVGAGESISPVSGEIYYYGDGSNLTGLNVPVGFNELDAALFN